MQVLTYDELPQGGFAGLRERQFVTDARVFGERKKRKPGSLVMENFRNLLQSSKYFLTYKENLPNDSLIFKYDKNTFQKGNGLSKEEFYDSQSIIPWTSGFDKNTSILVFILCIILVLLIIIKSVANNV